MPPTQENFKFEYNGKTFYTGNIKPKVKPLGTFRDYPQADLFTDEQIRAVLEDPGRKLSRGMYGPDWLLNQGGRSSCNLYACAGALMRARDRKGLDGKVKFAPEFGYAGINRGKDQGSMLDDGMKWMTEKGIPLLGTVPYESYTYQQMFGGNMEAHRRASQEAMQHRYFEAYCLPTNDLPTLWRAMITAVLRNEQIVIAVHVGQQYMYTRATTWATAGFDRGPGNHAVACDDAIAPKNWRNIYDIKIDQYGSWGTDHGEKGRVLLTPHHVQEPSRYHCFYAIRSATTNAAEKCPTFRA